MVARGRGRRCEDLVFDEYRVSVSQDEKSSGDDGGDGYTRV